MMMQITTLIGIIADLSQFRLHCSVLWDAPVYKVYKIWVHCKISCHSLLKKLKVLSTEAYIELSHAICKYTDCSQPVRQSIDGRTFFLHQRHCYFCRCMTHEIAAATRPQDRAFQILHQLSKGFTFSPNLSNSVQDIHWQCPDQTLPLVAIQVKLLCSGYEHASLFNRPHLLLQIASSFFIKVHRYCNELAGCAFGSAMCKRRVCKVSCSRSALQLRCDSAFVCSTKPD